MVDMGKLYFIVDMAGNFYKLNKKNELVKAKDSSEASKFDIVSANTRIGGGKKAHFYTTIEAPAEEPEYEVDEQVYEAPEYDEVQKPTMFDTLNNNWEDMLTSLCYMSEHMDEYQKNLNGMLSDVDKEICDIMHYLEFNELDDADMLNASKMLQERRRHRREIKDELEKTTLMKTTFLDGAFAIKVQQSLEFMEKMKQRQYTPRKLDDLFRTATAYRASA